MRSAHVVSNKSFDISLKRVRGLDVQIDPNKIQEEMSCSQLDKQFAENIC